MERIEADEDQGRQTIAYVAAQVMADLREEQRWLRHYENQQIARAKGLWRPPKQNRDEAAARGRKASLRSRRK